MTRLICAVLPCLLAALAALAVAEPPPAEQQKLIDKLPQIFQLDGDTSSYAYRMAWPKLKGKLAGTTSLAVIEDPEVQAFFKDVQRLGERGDKLAPVFRFALNASFQELVVAGRPAAAIDDAKKAGSIYGLAIRPAEADREKFAALYQEAVKTVDSLLPPGDKAAQIQVGKTIFHVNGEEVFSAWDGKTLLLARQLEAAKWLASQAPQADKSLAGGKLFGETAGPLMAGQSAGPIALYYHDLRPFWKRHNAAAYEKLSWRSIDALAGATFVDGKGFRNRHYWRLGEKRTGLFVDTRGGSVNLEWLKRVPAEATAFATGYWDIRSFVLSMAAIPFGAMSMFSDDDQDEWAEMAQKLALVDAMFASFGPRYLYYRVPGKYGRTFPIPPNDMVIVASLKDAAAFEAQLKALVGMAGGVVPLAEQTIQGHKVYAVNVMYFSVYLAIMKDEVLIAFHPQLIKDALENWDKPGPALIDTPAYKAASAKLVKDPCFIFYIAPGGFIRGIYDRYIPLLQQYGGLYAGMAMMGQGAGADQPAKLRGLNLLLLPRGSGIGRHVTEATILSARDDGAGVLFDGYAPLLSAAYYWVGLQSMFRPFGKEGFASIVGYAVMPAGTFPEGASEEGERKVERREVIRREPATQPVVVPDSPDF